MKKILLIAGAAVLLTGCSSADEKSDAEMVTETTSQEEITESKTSAAESMEASTEILTEIAVQQPTEAVSSVNYGKQTYREVLENIYYNRKLPGFSEKYILLDDYDIEENDFLIYDIDNDGSDELIFRLKNYYTAGQTGRIYDHDSEGKLVLQFRAYPSFTFYENGAIKVKDSHNQGNSGSFWPYSMYRYDRETDLYELFGFVEALDLELVEMKNAIIEENDGTNFIEYPYEIDTSNSGFVYYIRPDRNRGAAEPVDVTKYNEMDRDFTGGTEPLELEFIKLTEENIQNVTL